MPENPARGRRKETGNAGNDVTNQQSKKGKGRRPKYGEFSLESSFVSALKGEKSKKEEKFLWMEIENLRNQIKSMTTTLEQKSS